MIFCPSAKSVWRNYEKKDTVRIQPVKDHKKPWQKATVRNQVNIRSYEVRTEDGVTYRQNRRHLKVTQEQPVNPTVQLPSPTILGDEEAEEIVLVKIILIPENEGLTATPLIRKHSQTLWIMDIVVGSNLKCLRHKTS